MFYFPYAQIEKDTRVILYGAGRVGQDYIYQIAQSEYCSLLFIVDSDWKRLGVRDPEQIRLTPAVSYDHVIIAIKDRNATMEARDYLLDLGVEEKKIVVPRKFLYIPAADTNLERFLSGYGHTEIRQYFNTSTGNIDYFNPLIDDIKARKHDRERLLRRFIALLDDEDDISHKILLIKILFSADLFSDGLLRQYMDIIGHIDEIDMKYMLLMDIVHMIFLRPQYLYDEFYTDRRRALDSLADEYDLHYPAKERPRDTRIRVCVLSFVIGHYKAVVNALRTIAQSFSGKNCAIQMIAFDPMYYSPHVVPKVPITTFPSSLADKENNDAALGSDIVYITEKNIRLKQQKTLDAISDFSPDIIIDCSDDYTILSGIYSQFAPVLYVPIRDTNNSQHNHKVYCSNVDRKLAVNARFQTVPEDKMMVLPIFIEKPPQVTAFARSDHGFQDSDFLAVTVGDRLHYDLTPEFIDAVCGLLTKEPAIKWLLVGKGIFDYIKRAYANLVESGQIVFWGYEEKLAGLYGMCDLYINPNRLGGGLSISEAIACSLPIATTKNAYAGAWFVDENDVVDGDYYNLMDFVLKLYKDKNYYKKAVTRVKQRAYFFSFEKFSEIFYGQTLKMIADWKKGLLRA